MDRINTGMDEHHLRLWLQTPGLNEDAVDGILWFLEHYQKDKEDLEFLRKEEGDSQEEIAELDAQVMGLEKKLVLARKIYQEIRAKWVGVWPTKWTKQGLEVPK